MSHRITAAVVGLGLAVSAAPALAQTPTSTDKQNAAKTCKALRTASGGGENFRSAVATLTKSSKVTTKNAYGKCVSFHAKDEAAEVAAADKAAKTACKAEREAATTPEAKKAFQEKYGAKNEASAYGKCVSAAAKAKKAEADKAETAKVNAAKTCKAERGTTTESQAAFKAKYRTFGKCVSTIAKAKSQTQS